VPRVIATTVFVALLFTHGTPALVINFAAVALPYLAMLAARAYSGNRSPLPSLR
jgi:hypothetical protein